MPRFLNQTRTVAFARPSLIMPLVKRSTDQPKIAAVLYFSASLSKPSARLCRPCAFTHVPSLRCCQYGFVPPSTSTASLYAGHAKSNRQRLPAAKVYSLHSPGTRSSLRWVPSSSSRSLGPRAGKTLLPLPLLDTAVAAQVRRAVAYRGVVLAALHTGVHRCSSLRWSSLPQLTTVVSFASKMRDHTRSPL